MHFQDCDWIKMFMFHFRNEVTVFGFLRFLSSNLIYLRRNWLANSVCRTTWVENMNQTLTASPLVELFNNIIFNQKVIDYNLLFLGVNKKLQTEQEWKLSKFFLVWL